MEGFDMRIELTNKFNRPTDVDITITDHEVVFSLDHVVIGVFKRVTLNNWLTSPVSDIGDASTTLMAVPNGVALAIDDVVPMWPLSDTTLDWLRDSVRIENRYQPRAAKSRRGVHV